MQTETVDREYYAAQTMNPVVERRLRSNILHLIKGHGLVRETYHEQLEAFTAFTELESVYAEQAMHGRPVYKDLAHLCEKFGITIEMLLFEDLTAVPA